MLAEHSSLAGAQGGSVAVTRPSATNPMRNLPGGRWTIRESFLPEKAKKWMLRRPAVLPLQSGDTFACVLRAVRRKIEAVRARGRARREALRPGVHIARGVRFGRGVRCEAEGGASIAICRDVEVGAGTSLSAASGAAITINERVFIAGGCIIAARNRIDVGAECMLAELVSVRDHDHDPAFPPRSGRTLQAPVAIGQRVWVGAKATIVRGVRIGDDAVIGAHALVNKDVPDRALAAGVPATVRRIDVRAKAS